MKKGVSCKQYIKLGEINVRSPHGPALLSIDQTTLNNKIRPYSFQSGKIHTLQQLLGKVETENYAVLYLQCKLWCRR